MTESQESELNFRPIEELLADLDFWTGRSKLELVYEAVERWGAIVPHLLARIEYVLADPEGYCEQDHDLLPYALILLAHFREERAHSLILSLFSQPGDLLDELLGDMKTTGLPALLLRTCGGNLDGVRSLILNRNANGFIRWAAMESLCLAVAAGMADREETIRFLAGLLTGEEAEPDSHFWTGVAHSLCDLYPVDVMDAVRMAYADGLIIPGSICMNDFEYALKGTHEDALDNVREELAWRIPDDIDQLVAWCEDIGSSAEQGKKEQKTSNRKKNNQRKKKKKMAKSSRRKNR
jgi:hypothetical protein